MYHNLTLHCILNSLLQQHLQLLAVNTPVREKDPLYWFTLNYISDQIKGGKVSRMCSGLSLFSKVTTDATAAQMLWLV